MGIWAAILPVLLLGSTPSASDASRSAPTTNMVEVEAGVELEVVDWGGSGPPLVFLAGFGGTAHSFDQFPQRFTSQHRVLAITRRGFGASSSPQPLVSNFTPERLAADVIAVLSRLGIERPFLAGHSVAGQELSEIGTRYPGKIAGLIYLDAANSQAFYGPRSSVLYPIAGEVRRDLERLIDAQPSEAPAILAKLDAEIPRLQRGLEWYRRSLRGVPDRPLEMQKSPQMAIQTAVVVGARIYGKIDAPILSVVAIPRQCAPDCETEESKALAAEDQAQVEDFASANAQAIITRLPYASHFIWQSNGDEVERAMNSFMKMNAPR
jgi:non-heme chloroperoxidase